MKHSPKVVLATAILGLFLVGCQRSNEGGGATSGTGSSGMSSNSGAAGGSTSGSGSSTGPSGSSSSGATDGGSR